LSGGAFGIHTYLSRYSEKVAGYYLAAVVGLCILAAVRSVLVRQSAMRWPVWTLLALGLLPFAHYIAVVSTSGIQPGIYSYLYKFAPYMTGLYWASVARTMGLRPLALAVKTYAAVVSIRQIAVFLLPGSLGAHSLNAVYDDTYVYSYVGSLPRVFGPGAMLMALAILLYVGDWSRRQLGPAGYVGLAMASAASLTTLTRGTNLLLVAMVTASIFLPIKIRQRRGVSQTFKTIAGIICLFVIVSGLYLAGSGRLEDLLPGAGDRVTADTTTFNWRYAQFERAFVRSDAWRQNWLFGVGPETFIQNDSNDSHYTVNELHYSYASVLWTFGATGLGLLLGSLFGAARYGWDIAQRSPRGLEWYLGVWMFIIAGVYTPTFTENSAALGLTICTAAIMGSVRSVRRGRSARGTPRSVESGCHAPVVAGARQ
jgi:hypothetical protein